MVYLVFQSFVMGIAELWLFLSAKKTVCNVFPNVFVHPLPIIFMCMNKLVTLFVVSFHEYCIFPRFRNDQNKELFTSIHDMFV